MQTIPPKQLSFSTDLHRAISSTRKFFFNHQHPDGYWVAELEGDALLQSEAIMLLTFLGEEDSDLARKCAQHLLDTQFEDGGWGQYTHGKSDVCNTVKAYFALKIMGHSPNEEYMQRARERALELGGGEKANSFTRFYLAILGQIPHEVCPAVPPQMLFLPSWFPVNIYDMSAWSRTIFVPLSIVSALRPVRKLPSKMGIQEIFVRPPDQWGPLIAPGKKFSRNPFSWDFFFRRVNSIMGFCRKIGLTPLRRVAIKRALDWTLERFKRSDGPGAIQPPIVWSWIALKVLGYKDDSKEVQYCRKQFMDLVIEDKQRNSARLQPCKSPVWDTSLTVKSLMIGGLTASNPGVKKALDWIRVRQIINTGDWSKKVKVEPGGWCFEFHNDFYPDCDDTAMALMVLAGRFDESKEAGGGRQEEMVFANADSDLQRGLHWLLSMQCKDGGWAAFDRENNKEMLCAVPFADHNAMIDPSTPDLTGRVMEALGRLGFRVGHNVEIDRVVEFMRKQQKPNGSWFGRWGVNYIYGTWQALTGLAAVGVPLDAPMIQMGADWLLKNQHDSGGWGETPDSYTDEAAHGRGIPTASQTAWAVMGLIAAGRTEHPAVQRGIQFLIERQREDGTWEEPEYTGTGFPLVFYLKYHYYSVYFPLMALSLYATQTQLGDLEHCVAGPKDAQRVFAPEKNEFYRNSRR